MNCSIVDDIDDSSQERLTIMEEEEDNDFVNNDSIMNVKQPYVKEEPELDMNVTKDGFTADSTPTTSPPPCSSPSLPINSPIVSKPLELLLKQYGSKLDIDERGEYELIEFKCEHKASMIAILNACIPEVEPITSLEETKAIYWKLATLVQFFNMMFEVSNVLFIQDYDVPSIRHLNLHKLHLINRYIRFWLSQFYYCDKVINSLRFETGQIAMTIILVLNIFSNIRDSLPQIRPIFDLRWAPTLTIFGVQLQPFVRFDQLNVLILSQLENERIEHRQTKQTIFKLKEELMDTKINLAKSRSNIEKLKAIIEKGKQDPSMTLNQKTSPIQQISNDDGKTIEMAKKPQFKSLLNHSGSGTITITTNTGETQSSGNGILENSLISPNRMRSPSPTNSYLIGIPSRRRGRPRKNPLLATLKKQPVPLRPLISCPSSSSNMTSSSSTSLVNSSIMSKTIAPLPTQTSLILQPTGIAPANSVRAGTMLTTGTSVVTVTSSIGPTMMVQPQSILTPIGTNPMLKKVRYNSSQCPNGIISNSTPSPSGANQLYIAPQPTMMSVVGSTPMVSLTPGPINIIQPVTSYPSLLVQGQASPIVSFTLQPQPTNQTSLIAASSIANQPNYIAANNTTKTSLLIKTEPTTLGSPDTSRNNVMSNVPIQSISPLQQTINNVPQMMNNNIASKSTNSGDHSTNNLNGDETLKDDSTNKNKFSMFPKYSMSKFYEAKYPNSTLVDVNNLPLYYIQRSETWVKCRLCSRRLDSMQIFEEHFKEHVGARVFHCNWENCNSFFLSNYKLKRHQRCHTGERPYACFRCVKSFTRSDKLKEHMKHCRATISPNKTSSDNSSTTTKSKSVAETSSTTNTITSTNNSTTASTSGTSNETSLIVPIIEPKFTRSKRKRIPTMTSLKPISNDNQESKSSNSLLQQTGITTTRSCSKKNNSNNNKNNNTNGKANKISSSAITRNKSKRIKSEQIGECEDESQTSSKEILNTDESLNDQMKSEVDDEDDDKNEIVQ
ncbi:Zinc finger protein plagl1 [Blomia tropicalis]|nr:Zinc finger protein plagl1 [Blomia tropicalis]